MKAADAGPEEEPEEVEVPKAQLWCACNQVSIAKTYVPIAEPQMLKLVYDGRIPGVYGCLRKVYGCTVGLLCPLMSPGVQSFSPRGTQGI